jgi:hypothetical protein
MWQRLVRLHRYNGWNLLLLFVTGVMLFTPAVRVYLAPVRVAIKWVHIGSGLLSLLFLVLYLKDAAAHWLKLGKRVGQRLNVLLLGALLLGWGATGAVLWYHAALPPAWANLALLWHDRLTWFAIPWVVGHSVTRYFKLRLLPVTAEMEGRRAFLAGVGAFVGALLWRRVGQSAGFPGLEGPLVATHEPVGPDFQPPAVGTAPGAAAAVSAYPGSTWNGLPGEKPPGRQGRFRIYSVTDPMPVIKPEAWRLTVDGLVERPLALDWAGFTNLATTSQVSDFHCVTGWSVWGITWTGVLLRDLLVQAGVKPGATWVKFYSGDGIYTSAVPLEVAVGPDVLVAHQIDGAPLPGPLGGPVRLVVPNLYGWKSVKWLERIELIAQEHIGFWEERGYPNDARIRI